MKKEKRQRQREREREREGEKTSLEVDDVHYGWLQVEEQQKGTKKSQKQQQKVYSAR